jgi:hypothetical protein
MAFLIPDNLKSRQDVPPAIRRVASAFEISLDDSAIVWYEPLFDSSGERPHLVIMLPERGIVLMEIVDVTVENFAGTERGKPKFLRDGQQILDPLNRAIKLSSQLVQQLNSKSKLAHLGLRVSACVCLTGMTSSQADAAGVTEAYNSEFCIYKNEIDDAISGGQSTMMRAFTRVVGPPLEQLISSDAEKSLRGLIQPETVILKIKNSKEVTASANELLTEDEDIILIMDRQQEAMAKSLGEGHRVIRGVAGSGKTLLLIFRAKLIAENFPDKQVLVTCYTRTLASQLRVYLANFPNVSVVHLHTLMADICKKAKLKTPKIKDEGSFEKTVELSLASLEKGVGSRYDVVLVDEAQDFSTDALKFVAGLLKEGCEDLVIVADAAQNIFKRKFSWRQAGVKAQGRTRILRINYRNTREILDSASKFLLRSSQLHADEVPDMDDEYSVIPPESAKRSGMPPEIQVVENVKAEVSATIDVIKKWIESKTITNKIAILYPGSDGLDRGWHLNKKLEEAGIPVYWVNKPYDHGAKSGLALAKEQVILSTIHSAKGLEYESVVLCGIWTTKNALEENRKLAYVGMTRATERLTVVTRDGHELSDDLKNAFLVS